MSALHLQQQFGIWLALVFLISPLRYVSGAEFTYDFSGQTSDSWQFFFGASSRAIIEQGRLVLDMCEPKAGKWAVALLKRTFSLPCQIMWRQQLAHDSPYTWFCGVAVESAVSG
ncbi:MAG: hypothetical protein H5T86_03260, partial [Armatimonadetes bacterium]|nr:hypothetical protein [Armatimonadota bacterium]